MRRRGMFALEESVARSGMADYGDDVPVQDSGRGRSPMIIGAGSGASAFNPSTVRIASAVGSRAGSPVRGTRVVSGAGASLFRPFYPEETPQEADRLRKQRDAVLRDVQQRQIQAAEDLKALHQAPVPTLLKELPSVRYGELFDPAQDRFDREQAAKERDAQLAKLAQARAQREQEILWAKQALLQLQREREYAKNFYQKEVQQAENEDYVNSFKNKPRESTVFDFNWGF